MGQSFPSHELLIEQQKLLYQNSRVPIFFSQVLAIFLCWYLRHSVETAVLLSWLTIFSLISCGRLWMVFLASRSGRIAPGNKQVDLFFLSGVWLAAATWGSSSFLMYPVAHHPDQTVFMIVIVGISAGAITSLCPNWGAVSGFLSLTLLPLAVRLMTVHEPNGVVLGVLTALFWFVCLTGANKLHINITDNISLRLKSAEDETKIEHQASYDSLTGLPNRNLLLKLLDQELSRAIRHKQNGALLFMDLDNFKTINDSLGHNAGDILLKHVAQRISANHRKEDVITRTGGDEFVILLPNLANSIEMAAQKSQNIAKKLASIIAAPFFIENQEISITPSMGISLFPEQGKDANDVLKQADTAMNQAKTAGPNTVQFFRPSMQQAADKRLRLNNDIKKAIENDELSLHFQPQVRIDGTIVGGEGLLRWTHPDRGMIPPGEFIAVAEETGIIVDIGNWVLRRACQTIREWEDNRLLTEDQTIAVNISPREFSTPDFVDRVIKTIEETGVSPQHLDIELTEGSLISSVSDTITKIQTLRDYGVKFSVDDFGTGYSSLSYLKSLPLHTLKIDRSFVNDIRTDSKESMLVAIIIAMAHKLGMEIVAEGVESAEQLNYLASEGCNVFQGYYFCKPISTPEFRKLLESGIVKV